MTPPTLFHIRNVFVPMLHLQTTLEDSKTPSLFLVPSMLEHLKSQLLQLTRDVFVNQLVPGPAV